MKSVGLETEIKIPKDYLLCLSLQKKCHVLKIGSLNAYHRKGLTKCIFLQIFRKYFFAIPCCVKCPYLVKCLPKLPPFSISASNNFPRFSSIGAIIFSSDNPNASCSTYITAPENFHNPKYLSSLCTTSKAVEAEEVTAVAEPPELSPSIARRSHPAQFGEGFDAPIASRRSHPAQSGETFDGLPSLERSGSEHREGAVTSPLPEEEGLGEKVELPLAKGRRRDSKKKSYVRT